MKQSHLRLRSVTPKDGGARLRVLHNDIPGIVSRDLRNTAAYMADRRARTMAGYAIVAWSNDGGTSTRVFIGNGRPVPYLMAPEFVRTRIADHIASSPDEPSSPDGAA